MKLDGEITISRTTSGDKTWISITIHDPRSACKAVEATMTMEDFAQAVTGLGHCPCEVNFNDSGVIGKKHEHKVVEVYLPYGLCGKEITIIDIEAAFEEYEVDGWKGRVRDAQNHHKRAGDYYHVTFDRWVDADKET